MSETNIQPAAGDFIVLYGSLMRGFGAVDALGIASRLRFVGPCVCRGELYDLGDYPGLRAGEARVVAELHAVLDDDLISVLDEFEGYSPKRPRESLYLRERINLVEPVDAEAWIYLYNAVPDAATRVTSGDWRAHLLTRNVA